MEGDGDNDSFNDAMRMGISLKKPCKECPFRRTSFPGWLGPWDVEGLLFHLGRGPFPCHCTIKSSDTPYSQTEGCAGATIFLNNKCERSRFPRTAEHQDACKEVPADVRDSVFSTAQEFRDHHTKLSKLEKKG